MEKEILVKVTVETDAFPENREDPAWETDKFIVIFMDEHLYDRTRKEHGYPWRILGVELQ